MKIFNMKDDELFQIVELKVKELCLILKKEKNYEISEDVEKDFISSSFIQCKKYYEIKKEEINEKTIKLICMKFMLNSCKKEEKIYLTDFEKMMLSFIDNNNIKQYSDSESFEIFSFINEDVRNNLDVNCLPINYPDYLNNN